MDVWCTIYLDLDATESEFPINFCNIRGLFSNFACVEQHHLSSVPSNIFLTKPSSNDVSVVLFSIPNYILFRLCVISSLSF